MNAALALALFCGAIAIESARLSPTAGRLPLVIALLTLAPVLWQLRMEAKAAPREQLRFSAEYPLFVAALFLAGFMAAIPAYAAWAFRQRAITAVIAAACAAVFLLALDQQLELYRGVIWPR